MYTYLTDNEVLQCWLLFIWNNKLYTQILEQKESAMILFYILHKLLYGIYFYLKHLPFIGTERINLLAIIVMQNK